MIDLDDIINAAQELADEDMVRLYVDEKWNVTRIAKQAGCSRDKVYRRLTQAGVHIRPDKPGAQRREKCGKGVHDMSVHGVELPKDKGGGRYCRACATEREQKRRGKTDEQED
jgi:transposase-like protein